jgi:hypothetical protein
MSSQMTILPQTCRKLSQHSGPRKIEILFLYKSIVYSEVCHLENFVTCGSGSESETKLS